MSKLMEDVDIAIIGGGPGGLISLYECYIRNIKATLYEKENSCGGVWNLDIKSKKAHKSTTFNTSSIVTSYYLEFTLDKYLKNKYPGKVIDFPASIDYQNYLHDFIEYYQLTDRIICNTEIVEIISEYSEPKFSLKTRNSITRKEATYVHNYVVIATGLYGNSIVPDHPFLNNQLTMNTENVWHSCEWDPLDDDSPTCEVMNKKNPRILVIGGGHSAAEAMNDMLIKAKKVNNYKDLQIFWAPTRQPTERSVWFLDRYPHGKNKMPLPVDAVLCRLFECIPKWLVNRELKKICKVVALHEKNATPDVERDRICICDIEVALTAIKDKVIQVLPDAILQIYKSKSNHLMFDSESSKSNPIDAVVIGSGYNYNDLKVNGKFLLDSTQFFRYIIPIDKSYHGRIAFVGTTMEIGSSMPVFQMEMRWIIYQWFNENSNLEYNLERLRSKNMVGKSIRQKRIVGIALDSLAVDMNLIPKIWRNIFGLRRRQRHLGLAYLLGPWSIFQYAEPNETETEKKIRENIVLLSTERIFEKRRMNFRFICFLGDILYYSNLFAIFSIIIYNRDVLLSKISSFCKF